MPGEIVLKITEEQDLVFEYIPSQKYAEFKCKNCQTKLFDNSYPLEKDSKTILEEFKNKLESISLNNSEIIGRYFLTKYQITMKRESEDWMKEIDKIIDRLKTRETLNNERN
jgi:hypothetical protein